MIMNIKLSCKFTDFCVFWGKIKCMFFLDFTPMYYIFVQMSFFFYWNMLFLAAFCFCW